ncbi:long-chain fatty acid--CoA ligase [Ornithinimicrobium sp. LYQ121]|uniref:acyl-CoA synthetase n=1 Tax=Ornithinimicrobium sp. LYQ121 TaxID=3378801 RepID=UPI0038523DB4
MTSSTSGSPQRTEGATPTDAAGTLSAHALASSRIDNLGLGSWPARRARVRPDAVAWEFEGRETTYLEVHERTSRLADALSAAGVRPEDRVAYVGFNHPALLEVFFACGILGATAVLVNPRLSGPEVEFILGDCGAEVCFYGEAQVDNVARVLLPSDQLSVRRWVHVDHPVEGAQSIAHEDLMATGRPDRRAAEVPLGSVALIMYTSGTTGRPKGAMLTHQGLFYQYVNALIGQDLRQDEVHLTIAPLFHIAGLNMMTVPAFTLGGRLVIQRAFHAETVLRTIAEQGVTSAFFVPAMLDALSHQPTWEQTDLSSLRSVMVGGSPLSDRTITTWADRGVPLMQGFGMTETAPGARMLEPRDNRTKLGSAGRPHFFTDSRVVGLDGELAAPGEAGEILISGPNVMAGYWNRPEASKEALADGWYHTGDVGLSDEDGYLYIKDRIKDMYISGGENVYPAEVENALMSLPGVRDCAVVGVPDERWGESGMAFVEVLPDVRVGGEELREQLRGRLAGYKLPREVRVVETIPRTATGKVQKFRLRELADDPLRDQPAP